MLVRVDIGQVKLALDTVRGLFGLVALGLGLIVPVAWRVAAAGCGLMAAGWLAASVPMLMTQAAEADQAPAPVVTGSLPRAEPAWSVVSRPHSAFVLAAADSDGQGWRVSARRDQNSDMREERLSTGRFREPRLYADLSVTRHDPRPQGSLFVEASRALAPEGLAVLRGAQPIALQTKFGPMESADMLVAAALPDGQTLSRPCLVFRHQADEGAFRLQGLLCGSQARPADRQQLACLVDRLGLVSAGEDRDLRALFSRAELHRQPQCLTPKLEQAGRRVSWLDPDRAAPRLRR